MFAEQIRCSCNGCLLLWVHNLGQYPWCVLQCSFKAHNAAQVADWGIEVAVVGSGLINDKGTIAENLAEIQQALGA